MTIIVDIPPSVNHCYGLRNGKPYLTADAAIYKHNTAWVVKEATADILAWWTGSPLKITARIYFKDRRRHDLDNCLKLLGDSIADGLGIDDSLIDEWHVYKGIDRKLPRCEIEISEA